MARVEEVFSIYVDRLRNGQREQISESLPSQFLDVTEEELTFPGKVDVSGEVYATDDELILHLDAETVAQQPCSICNEPVNTAITIQNFYHCVPIKKIRGAIFDYSVPLREALLVEIPAFVECHEGKCPAREDMKGYISSKKKAPEIPSDYHPFADLNFEGQS